MHTRAAPRERLQDPDLYGDVTGEVLAFLAERIELARSLGVEADQLIVDPARLRQDARPDDPAALRTGPPARARSSAAAGGLAQGLHRRSDRPRPARARRRDARGAGARVERGGHIFRLHDVAAAADYLCVRAALAGELAPGRDLALIEELRYDRMAGE